MTAELLKAGVAREIISPTKGIYQIGYGDRVKGNLGIHDDLTATCVVLSSNETTLAWVAVDMLCLNEYIVDQIQAKVGTDTFVLITCSHTHSGPIAYADQKSPRKNRQFIEFLINQITKTINKAKESLVPAKITWAQGAADIATNRRERQPDGSIEIGINLDGPVDHSVNTLSIFDLNNQRLATLVNYASHGTVQGPKNLLISADWIGAMRASAEKSLGSPVLFIQGATADLNPQHGWEADQASWELVKKQGQAVADQVLRTLENKFEFSNLPLKVQQKEIWLPLETKVTSENPPKIYRKKILQMANLPEWLSFASDYLLGQRYPWRSKIKAVDGYWSIPLRIITIQIGQIGVVAFNAETFTEIGMEIKEQSPFTYTIFASISNGCIGYLPTVSAHDEGGYEVNVTPYSYRYPGRLKKNAADQAIIASLGELSRLKN